MIRRARVSFLIISMLAAATGCPRSNGQTAEAPQARRVAVVRPERRDVVRSITQPGNVLAHDEATLYAQVAGYLSSIAVDKGDAVRAGDVLATIDVPELRAERAVLEAAKAEADAELVEKTVARTRYVAAAEEAASDLERERAGLRLQRSLFERAKGLRADQAISAQELEVAEGRFQESQAAVTAAEAKVRTASSAVAESDARVIVAKARVGAAEAQLRRVVARIGFAEIRAPFDGVVTRRLVDPGAMVQQATASSTQASPLVTVAAIDRVRVDFLVPEADIARVASGQQVTLASDAYEGRPFVAKVERTAVALDAESRMMLVEAEYENRDHALRPGMFVKVTLDLERHARALTVPAEAVVAFETGACAAVVVVAGKIHHAPVVLGIDLGPIVEVEKGLAGDEQIVLGGKHLTEGMDVVPLERGRGSE